MEGIDLQVLQDYSDEENFLQELQYAPQGLAQSQIKAFYKIILSHFEEKVPEHIGKAILECLMVVLCNKKHMDKFASNSFALKLPYGQKNLTDPLLDVFYVIISRCPECLTDEIIESFSRLIVRRPQKMLTLISIYAQFFDELENPWTLIDLLLNGEDYFTAEDGVCANYLSVLSFLCREFPSFREGRYNECAEIATKCLKRDNPEILTRAYDCLSTIAQHKDDIQVPLKQIKQHISDPDVQESVLNFLTVCPIFPFANGRLIKRLLTIAQDNVVATLILMRFAVDETVSQILVEDSRWMNADLPTPEDTFRLFLVVFSHKKLRSAIGKTPEFIPLLQSLVDFKSSAMLQSICTVLRRMKLTHELVKRMSTQYLISNFLETADSIQTPDATYTSILFCDTLSKICFTKEFVTFCEVIAESCDSEDENFSPAVALAIDFTQFEKCVKKMRKLHLSEILRNSQYSNKKKVKELISLLEES